MESGSYPYPRTTGVPAFRKFSDGATQAGAEIEKPVAWGLAVSPDGHSVLFAQVDQSGSNLMLIKNFRQFSVTARYQRFGAARVSKR
jgi:hypothetical protein